MKLSLLMTVLTLTLVSCAPSELDAEPPIEQPPEQEVNETQFTARVGDNEQMDELYQQCVGDNERACVEMFFQSPPGSEYEQYVAERRSGDSEEFSEQTVAYLMSNPEVYADGPETAAAVRDEFDGYTDDDFITEARTLCAALTSVDNPEVGLQGLAETNPEFAYIQHNVEAYRYLLTVSVVPLCPEALNVQ